MFEFKFRNKVILGLAASGIVLLLVAAFTYSSLAHNLVDRRWVSHTQLVLERLSELQSEISNAESRQRGFLLTGDTAYLEPYQNSLSQIRDGLKAVRQLTGDNPVQQRNLNSLEQLIAARLASINDVLGIRTRDGFVAAAAAVAKGAGRVQMEEIRTVVTSMKAEEDRLMLIRSAELNSSTNRSKLIIIFGETFGFCLLVFAGVVIHQEMTKRRRGEDEIRRLNADLEDRVAQRTLELAERSKDLERSNTELQQFAYVASHDLQEPLRTISSFTQLLAKRYRPQLDDKAQEFIDFAVNGCQRMQTLINDLLAFSRVGTQAKPLQPVSGDEVFDQVLKNLRVAIQESGAIIQRDPLPVVMADDVQLGELFQNLIANAIKFRGHEPPHIHVSAQRNNSIWTITVRDNGIGISPRHADRIFVIFQRLHTRTEYPGTGIGLALCKKIAERHGGRIWVQESPRGGSDFCFTMIAGEQADAGSREKIDGQLRAQAAAH